MSQWAIHKAYTAAGEWRLSNRTSTLLTFNHKVDFGIIEALIFKMNELNVPFAFSNGLHEINFTFLNGIFGDYLNNKIRLNCGADIDLTFIHELGHHIDDYEKISCRKKILCEHKNNLQKEPVGGRFSNIDEYVAIGFEKFYFGNKNKLKCCNPKLYNVILHLDRKYKKY